MKGGPTGVFTEALVLWRMAAWAVLRGMDPAHTWGADWIEGHLLAEPHLAEQVRLRGDDWMHEQIANADAVVAESVRRAYEWLAVPLVTELFTTSKDRNTVRTLLSIGRLALDQGVIDHHPPVWVQQKVRELDRTSKRTDGPLVLRASVRDISWLGAVSTSCANKAGPEIERWGFGIVIERGHGPTRGNGGHVKGTRWALTLPDKYVDAQARALVRPLSTTSIYVPALTLAGEADVVLAGVSSVAVRTASQVRSEPLVAVLDYAELFRREGLGAAALTLAALAALGPTRPWMPVSWLEAVTGLSGRTVYRHLAVLRDVGRDGPGPLAVVELESDATSGWQTTDPGMVRLAVPTVELRRRLADWSGRSGAADGLAGVRRRIASDRERMHESADGMRPGRWVCLACGMNTTGCECSMDERRWVSRDAVA